VINSLIKQIISKKEERKKGEKGWREKRERGKDFGVHQPSKALLSPPFVTTYRDLTRKERIPRVSGELLGKPRRGYNQKGNLSRSFLSGKKHTRTIQVTSLK